MNPTRWWYGEGVAERVARGAAWPAAALFGAGVRLRNALYDRGWLARRASSVPVVSVGNITVGGTGKTPIAAAIARRLREMGARPAVVVSGYGADEVLLHPLLTPGVPVIADRDRVRGIRVAAERGADVAVLDDAFQHRRAARDLDVVVVAAEQWLGNRHLLPSGPGREPVSALRRSGLVIITRKAASPEEAARVARDVGAHTRAPVIMASIEPAALEHCAGPGQAPQPVSALGGQRVLAITAIGEPRSFLAQLRARGAAVDARIFPDHHDYSPAEAHELATRAASFDLAVTTRKDAVKLAALWPAKGKPLWYVSQAVVWSDETDAVGTALRRLVSHRHTNRDSHGH